MAAVDGFDQAVEQVQRALGSSSMETLNLGRTCGLIEKT